MYPGRCPVCGQIWEGICDSCMEKVHFINQPRCCRCGKPLWNEETEYCSDCRKSHHFFQQGLGLFLYEGDAREAIHRVKYENKREYLDTFAKIMAERFHYEIERWDPEVLIPIPMYHKKQRIRGFNQAQVLALQLEEYTGIPVDIHLLKKNQNTGEQKNLTREERRHSLQKAFQTDCSTAYQRVLLIDDVYTTGSTIDAAACVLQKAGVKEIFFLTICIGAGDS